MAEDQETRDLIDECMKPLADEVRTDYLINCLVLAHYQNMTVKEIFKAELKAKKEFEKEMS